jgi:hypothetical protein
MAGARADNPAAARDAAPGFLRGGKRLGNEGPRALRALGADAAWADAEIVIPRHALPRTSQKAEQRQTLARFRMLRTRGAPRGIGA